MTHAVSVVAPKATTGNVVPAEAKAAIAKYEAMCLAIKECHSLDVAKEMQTQAAALAVYNKQAGDTQSEYLMREIRIRAQRRAGEILTQMAEDGNRVRSGGDYFKEASSKSTSKPTLSALGITHDQASDWQALAKIPEPVFEQHLSDLRTIGKRPVTQNIAALGRVHKPRAQPEMATPETPAYIPPSKPRTPKLDADTLRSGLYSLVEIESDAAAIVAQFPDWERESTKEELDKVVTVLTAIQQAWGA